ncbi:MAG: hypothetical protein IT384_02340 [Deltaproteobacteria bacterium]|nr:hypothetical protein [Deltaproteobacteria bacterium]
MTAVQGGRATAAKSATRAGLARPSIPAKQREAFLRLIAPELRIEKRGHGWVVDGLPDVHDPSRHVYFSPEIEGRSRPAAIAEAWRIYAESGVTSRAYGSKGGEYKWGGTGWDILSGQLPTAPIRTTVRIEPEPPPRTTVFVDREPQGRLPLGRLTAAGLPRFRAPRARLPREPQGTPKRVATAPPSRGPISPNLSASYLAQICPHLEVVEESPERWAVRGLPSAIARGVYPGIAGSGASPDAAIVAAFEACREAGTVIFPDLGQSFSWTGGAWSNALGELPPPKRVKVSEITRSDYRLSLEEKEAALREAFPSIRFVERSGCWVAENLPERKDGGVLVGLSATAATRSGAVHHAWALCGASHHLMVTDAEDPKRRKAVRWSRWGWASDSE